MMMKLLETFNQHPTAFIPVTVALGIVLAVILNPILNHFEYKKLVKKEGKEYADAYFRRKL